MYNFRQHKKLFITGTDTNIGKTVASAWLMHRGFRYYWKPVQTGSVEGCDSDVVRQLCSDGWPAADIQNGVDVLKEAYVFREPLSPHLAAKRENTEIDFFDLVERAKSLPDLTLIEGAGGIMVPLTPSHTFLDWLEILRWPVCVVTHPRLGTINHTLLTLSALYSRKIEVVGLIMNGQAPHGLIETLETLGHTKILVELPYFSPLNGTKLQRFPRN